MKGTHTEEPPELSCRQDCTAIVLNSFELEGLKQTGLDMIK
jgi:hypothetical protein